MIVRREDYDGFKCFDFFNDTDDTVLWLWRVGRNAEALELQKRAEEFHLSDNRFRYGDKREAGQ
jgi:hypothetical protein